MRCNVLNPVAVSGLSRRALGRCLVTLFLLGGAHSALAATPPPTAPYVSTRAEQYEYHVLAGEMAIQRGDRVLAAREYADAVRFSKDPTLAERATRISVYADQSADAYQAAKVWSDGARQSVEAQRAATRLAFVAGDADGAMRYAQRLVGAAPSPDMGYRMVAEVFAGEPAQADLAIHTLQRMAKADAKSAPAEYALGRVALGYNRMATASTAAAAAQTLDPDWADAVLLRAGVLIRQGKVEAAERQIDALPGSASKRARYHASLARLLLQAGNNKSGRDEFKRAVAIDASYSDARFGWALVSLGLGDMDVAKTQFKHLYDQHNRADDAAYYLGAIAEEGKHYVRAQHWYQRAQNGRHAFEAQLRAAQMIYRQGRLQVARERMAQLRETYPGRAGTIRAAESDLLLDAGKTEQALAVINAGLKTNPDNSDLLYGRSLIYERMGRVKAAEADLQAMLAEDSHDPRALNALGYMLTNHSTDYSRAHDLIARALKADPDNPAVLDSMGWVQYKLGQLDKARANLEKAYKGDPEAEVAAHLGEVRWQQGDHEAARRIWHDAASKAPDNTVLQDTIKRFGP